MSAALHIGFRRSGTPATRSGIRRRRRVAAEPPKRSPPHAGVKVNHPATYARVRKRASLPRGRRPRRARRTFAALHVTALAGFGGITQASAADGLDAPA